MTTSSTVNNENFAKMTFPFQCPKESTPEAQMSFWRNFRFWLYWRWSFWQLPSQWLIFFNMAVFPFQVPELMAYNRKLSHSTENARSFVVPCFFVLRLRMEMPSKVSGKVTYQFPNFNGATVEVWEWISKFKPHTIMGVVTYPCWD